MREFYQQIENVNPNYACRSVTLLDGDTIGEQAILSDGKVVWTSLPDGFLAGHREELAALSGNGEKEIDGRLVYTEMVGQAKKVVVCGGGHVAISIIRLCKMIGCRVTDIEDRPVFAEHAKEAGADTVICDDFEHAMDTIEGDLDTFFIIVTRGHQWDSLCLRSILKKKSAYVGMMGSRRRVRMVKDDMIRDGYDKNLVESVHTPIGVNIGAETPEEIAVSVVAELIQVKNAAKSITYSKEIMKTINGTHHDKPYDGRIILAEIISRKGSAPREVGTKMLLLDNGSFVGTIGGGCTEADVITAARQMFMEEKAKPRIIHVDMMADEAAEEGEVCGGLIDVWMEEIV